MYRKLILILSLQVFVYHYGTDAYVYDYRSAPTPSRPTFSFYHDSAPYYVIQPQSVQPRYQSRWQSSRWSRW